MISIRKTFEVRRGDAENSHLFSCSPVPLSRRSRRGFSLTELLVVIAIIGLLIATAYVVLGDAFGTAKRSATVATIKKLDEVVGTRMDAFNRWLRDQSESLLIERGKDTGLAYTNDEIGNQLLVIRGKKEFFRKYFPQTFGEVGISGGPLHSDITESSEVLYLMLTDVASFGAEAISPDTFTANEVTDTDGDGFLEFVDGWGQPLRFYRWPTCVFRQTPTGGAVDTYAKHLLDAKSLFVADPTTMRMPVVDDPDDPIGLIENNIGGDVDKAQDFEDAYHTPSTWHTPLIVSAGKDGLLGLYEPTNVANKGTLAYPLGTGSEMEDNITNLNQRAGTGKKK